MPDMNKKEAGELLKAIAKEYGFNVIEVEPGEGGIFYKGKKLSIEEIFEEFKNSVEEFIESYKSYKIKLDTTINDVENNNNGENQ